MSELIQSPRYWKRRLREATANNGPLHHAVFKCPLDRWRRIEDKHRQILSNYLGGKESVLDCGCGWGRLLDLMPEDWQGDYLGVDLSPDFIALAKESHPGVNFDVGDLVDCDFRGMKFDVAIMISIRPMIKRHLGEEHWARIEANIRKHVGEILFLEYDEDDPGSLE